MIVGVTPSIWAHLVFDQPWESSIEDRSLLKTSEVTRAVLGIEDERGVTVVSLEGLEKACGRRRRRAKT